VPANEYLGQEEFQVIVSPARVAYLIREKSESGYRRAVEEASTRWGGVSEPIVWLDEHGKLPALWEQIVQCAAVDELVNVDEVPTRAEAIGRELGLPVVAIEHIDVGIGRLTCHPSAVTRETVSNPNKMFGDGMALATVWHFAEPSLGLWALTAGGALSSSAKAQVAEQGDAVARQTEPMNFAMDQIGGQTLIDRTASQFEECWVGAPSPIVQPAIVWIVGADDQLLECTYYWNLRALRSFGAERSPMLILPDELIDGWLGFHNQIDSLLLRRPDLFAPDVALMSLKVDAERRRAIAGKWGLIEDDNPPRSTYALPLPSDRTRPFTFRVDVDFTSNFLGERRYGETTHVSVQVFREETTVDFESPVRFRGPGQFLATFGSRVLNYLPRREALARRVHQNGTWGNGGLVLGCHTLSPQKHQIRLPSSPEVVAVLLGDATAHWSRSDKGQIGERVSEVLESAELLGLGMFEAIRELTTRRSTHLYKEIERREHTEEELDRARFVAESGGRFDRRFLSASQLGSVPKEHRVDVAERLVALGLAERGYRVDCDRCGLTSFVPVPTVDAAASCPGCRAPQRYVRGPSALDVFYRLNSLIDHASDQGVLPHLMAIAALSGKRTDVFGLPGVDLRFVDDSVAELDLFGIAQGKVFAGEVKTSTSEFTLDQVARDVALSKRVQADIHVLACIEEVDADVLAEATRLASEAGLTLEVLGPSELRPQAG
jgi:hypothetical protein